MQVTAILVYGPICNKYFHFLDGNYYVAKTSCGVPVIDQWTKQPSMIKRHFEQLRVYPLQQLRQKVILYPDSTRDHFLTTDPDGPLEICEVQVPHFPTPNEVVEFKEGEQTKLMRVTEGTGPSMRGHQLCKIRGSQRWVPGDEVEVPLLNCIGSVDYTLNCGYISLRTSTPAAR